MRRAEDRRFMASKMGPGGTKCHCCNWTRSTHRMRKDHKATRAMKGKLREYYKRMIRSELKSMEE